MGKPLWMAGGYFGDKTAEEVYDIYEMLATNSQQKEVRGRRAGIHKVTSNCSNLAFQIDEFSRKLNVLINRNAWATEQCSFYRVMGHNDANCGMTQEWVLDWKK